MELTVTHTFLLVHDQDIALAFYRDTLGLEVRNDVQFGGLRWLTVGSPAQPELEIGLMKPDPDYSPAEDIRAAIEVTAKGLIPGLIFATPDLDGTFEELRAKGVDVEQEPIDQPYGVRDCAFRDPSGNHLRFAQAAKS
jgi:catechol 2,3-dioxygenase-like lactoylglutathione lyase family enzyme